MVHDADAGHFGHGHVHGLDLSKINLSALPEKEREHLLLHQVGFEIGRFHISRFLNCHFSLNVDCFFAQKHAGHEGMHAMMLLILIAAILIAQAGLIWWRKKSLKTYQNVSMFGM